MMVAIAQNVRQLEQGVTHTGVALANTPEFPKSVINRKACAN
jgi:hypothetical protein